MILLADPMTDAARFRRLLDRHDLTLEELVEEADALVRKLAPKQTRYKVTERPDARTIRYYVTQKLLGGPLSYEGGRARYGGSHILRLVLIKRLQAEHHTLGRIARVLQSASDEQVVEALLAGTAPQQRVPAEAAPQQLAGGPLELPPRGPPELSHHTLPHPESRRPLPESLHPIARWLRNTDSER